MSDDEEYYDELYDDGEDWIYFDELTFGLADELAEHTLASPVFQDDPRFEMMESYSDWEYYSDDYYDDDPTILNTQADKGESRGSQQKPARGKRKRKLTKTEDIPDLDLDSAASSFKGVVWRGTSPEGPPFYQSGKHKKVALLKDWREVFKGSQPKFISKKRATNKLRRQREVTPEPDQLSIGDGDTEEENPPKKRKKAVAATGKGHEQPNGPKKEPESASVRPLRTNGRNGPVDSHEAPAQNKKRKAVASEEEEKPKAKKTATGKSPTEKQPLSKRTTRSRKADA